MSGLTRGHAHEPLRQVRATCACRSVAAVASCTHWGVRGVRGSATPSPGWALDAARGGSLVRTRTCLPMLAGKKGS